MVYYENKRKSPRVAEQLYKTYYGCGIEATYDSEIEYIWEKEKPNIYLDMNKAILRKEESGECVTQSFPNGIHEITIEHGKEYDYMYDNEDNFYIIVDDILYPETSTAFDFINSKL